MERPVTITPQQEIDFVMTFDAELKAFQKANEGVFIHYEEGPDYLGGYEAMLKFLHENVKYPLLSQEKRIQGTVFVQFQISITGKISKCEILRGIGGGCDEEAIRVVKMMPHWSLNRFWGAVEPCMFQIPVKFQLTKENSN